MSPIEHYFENLLTIGSDIEGKSNKNALSKEVQEAVEICANYTNSVLEDIKAEIKQWYWQADKQAIAKDPCVVDAMVDLFIRTIDKHIRGKDDKK